MKLHTSTTMGRWGAGSSSILLLLLGGCGEDSGCRQGCADVVQSDAGVDTSDRDTSSAGDASDGDGDGGSPSETPAVDASSSSEDTSGDENSSNEDTSGDENSSSEDTSGDENSSSEDTSGDAGTGDSSGADAGRPTISTLQGTAAVGAPIADGTVTAVCHDGDGFAGTVVTDSNGTWSVDISSSRLPCALQLSFGDPTRTLHSYAAGEGTTNITPLTDLVIALASNDLPGNWFASTGMPSDPTGSVPVLLDAMSSAGFSLPAGGFDPFSTSFNAVAEDPYDALLEALSEAIQADGTLEDYAALVARVKEGELASFPQAFDSGIEDPEDDWGLLIEYSGTYSVACDATAPESRGLATRKHERGTVTVGADGSIDFDSPAGYSFGADDITQLFDRTTVEGDSRRIHINYDENDSGRRIDIYLNDALEVTEIRYQDGEGGRTRAAIGSEEHCDQGPQDEPELGDDNGASARENGLRKTYTGYAQALSGFNPNTPSFNFNGKASSVSTAAGWNIQGLLQPGDQQCEEDNVSLSLFVGGTTTPVLANTCTINVTTFPEPESGFNSNATIIGTFSGTFTVDGETVTVTEGVFQNQ